MEIAKYLQILFTEYHESPGLNPIYVFDEAAIHPMDAKIRKSERAESAARHLTAA